MMPLPPVPEHKSVETMHGGSVPQGPLSTLEQALLLFSALFCALLWRCLARSMERRARQREERKRRKSLLRTGSQGESGSAECETLLAPMLQNPRVVALGGRPIAVVVRPVRASLRKRSVDDGSFQRAPSDTDAAVEPRTPSPEDGPTRQSVHNLGGSGKLSTRRAGLLRLFDAVDNPPPSPLPSASPRLSSAFLMGSPRRTTSKESSKSTQHGSPRRATSTDSPYGSPRHVAAVARSLSDPSPRELAMQPVSEELAIQPGSPVPRRVTSD